jgi:hypothetical protein
MAAKKQRKAAPRKPIVRKKKARTKTKVPAKRKTSRKRKIQPATDTVTLPPFLSVDNPPPRPAQSSPPPAMDLGNSFEVAAQVIAMRPKVSNAVLSTGGVAEPVRVPLDSVPPVAPQPDLSRTAGPQLSQVSPIPDVADLDHAQAVEVIKEWFFSNFEDPTQSTPRVDGEFLYVWGGPYDARDEIGNAFLEYASEQVIEDAIRAVEAEGIYDWAPHGERGQSDHNEQAGAGTSDPTALHAEMVEQIEALEPEIADLRNRQHRGIGDNNPPEPIELEPAPLDENELDEISEAMAVLKRQPPAPSTLSNTARSAVALLLKFGDRLRPLAHAAGAYLAKQADNFVTEAVKEAGKRIVQAPLWLPIIYKLPALADIAQQWLQSLGPHF